MAGRRVAAALILLLCVAQVAVAREGEIHLCPAETARQAYARGRNATEGILIAVTIRHWYQLIEDLYWSRRLANCGILRLSYYIRLSHRRSSFRLLCEQVQLLHLPS